LVRLGAERGAFEQLIRWFDGMGPRRSLMAGYGTLRLSLL
jgi:hypothetical protein